MEFFKAEKKEDYASIIDNYVSGLRDMEFRTLNDSVSNLMSYAVINEVPLDLDNLDIALYNISRTRDVKEKDSHLEIIAKELYTLEENCCCRDVDSYKSLTHSFPFMRY